MATLALTAFAAPAQAALDLAPAGITLPVTGQAPIVTTGSEIWITAQAAWRGTRGLAAWSPAGWYWRGHIVVSTGEYVPDSNLAQQGAWHYAYPEPPSAEQVGRAMLRRAVTHCGRPHAAGADYYVAMVTRSGRQACHDFAANGLRASAWLGVQSMEGDGIGTLPPTPGWSCAHIDTDTYSVECTDDAGRCVQLLRPSSAAQAQLRRGKYRRRTFTYAAGRLPCA